MKLNRLFAGLGSDDNIRFIGEVERGAACDCFCPECGAPLLAKQGNEKVWHFAHEGGRERPECEAGSVNLLRRLAMQHLRTQETIELPHCKDRVNMRSPFRALWRDVVWSVRIVGAVEWVTCLTKYGPVGLARLDQGGELEIFVEISDRLSQHFPPGQDAKASVVFWSTLPVMSDRRKRSHAEQHLRRRGQFIWRHQPANASLVREAQQQLTVHAKKDEELFSRIRHGQ